MSGENDECSGWTSITAMPGKVAALCEVIRKDRRWKIHDVCSIVGMSHETCHCILSDEIGMRLFAAKFVPRLLTDDRKQHRLEVSMDLKEHVSNDPDFLSKVITGDESLIDGYDPEIKQQSSLWKCQSSLWLKKTVQLKSNVKSMLICFFDRDGIIHKEFVPPC